MLRVAHVCCHTFIENWLNTDSIVLDLGMETGGFSEYVIRSIGCQVYGAEARPDLYEKLATHNLLTARHVALAGESGEGILNINPTRDASLIIHENGAFPYKIRTLSLEKFIEENGLGIIDLVKIDIEGSEVAMLRHAPDNILLNVKQFTIEFHDFLVEDLRPDIEKLFVRFKELGFYRFNSYPSNYRRNYDVLLINKKFYRLTLLQKIRLLLFHKYLPELKRRAGRISG